MNYEVIFFEDNRGRSPVKDFLDELQLKATRQKSAKQFLSKIALYIEVKKELAVDPVYPIQKTLVMAFGNLGQVIIVFSSFFGTVIRLCYCIHSEKLRRKHHNVKYRRLKEKCLTG